MKIHAIRQGVCRHLHRFAVLGSIAVLSVTGAAQEESSLLNQSAAGKPAGTTSGVTFRNGQLVSEGQAFQVIDPSQLETIASSSGDGESDSALAAMMGGGVSQVGFRGSMGHSGCRSCGTASCGGACGGGIGGLGGGCGVPCDPYRYVHSEALYMKRLGDSRFTRSENFSMNDFDWEIAPRVTLGVVPDCVHGWEAGFTGPLEWNRGRQVNAAGLNAFQFPELLANPLYDDFFGADLQLQQHSAEYYSFEASRTLIGWQIAKVLYGVRYINYEENYNYFSQDGANFSEYRNEATNHLIGGQIGLDMFYPIARHAVADFRGRAGAYANFAETDKRLLNNAATVLVGGDDDVELAGVFEIGSGVRLNLGESLSIRAGSEFWYLTGLATSPSEVGRLGVPVVDSLNADDDIVIAGVSLSAELKY